MKNVCILCLLVIFTANTSFAARHNRGGLRKSGTTQSAASQNAPIDKAPTYKVEHQLLRALNTIRQQYGLRALVLDRNILLRARRHCGWMANARQMVHSADRCAENIAQGQPDIDAVMNAWMNSNGHRANILNPNYTKVGLSAYVSDNGSPFWCQQFE